VKVTLCERVSRLPASPFLITFQFHSLVVSCFFLTCFHACVHARHLALKGLKNEMRRF